MRLSVICIPIVVAAITGLLLLSNDSESPPSNPTPPQAEAGRTQSLLASNTNSLQPRAEPAASRKTVRSSKTTAARGKEFSSTRTRRLSTLLAEFETERKKNFGHSSENRSSLDMELESWRTHWPDAKLLHREVAPSAQNLWQQICVIQPDSFPHPVRIEETFLVNPETGKATVKRFREMVANRFLVKTRRPGQERLLGRQLTSSRVTVNAHPSRPQLHLVTLRSSAPASWNVVLQQLKTAKETVLFVEPDYIVRAAATLPDDPRFENGSLWGLDNNGQNGGTSDVDLDAPDAWDRRHDAPEILVGIIDTGLRLTHEDLQNNLWVNEAEIPNDGIDNDGNGVVDDVHGFNAISGTGDPSDDNGHGTHVAGTIGAEGNNGIGTTGVAWRVQLMALKFLDKGGAGTTADAIRCIDYAREHGARILNNSWGGPGESQALIEAVSEARTAGILVVAAAGNSAVNNDAEPNFPATISLDNVVAVASHTRNDRLSDFSNFGEITVDVAAPGSDIVSTWNSSDDAYRSLSGTSMAAPHVSGALALLMAEYPEASYLELQDRLYSGVDRQEGYVARTRTGGRINLARSIALSDPAEFPRITDPLRDVLSSLGEMVALSITAEGGEPLTFSWTLNGRTISGARGPELTIDDVQEQDAGTYRVTVINSAGSVTSTAQLRLLIPTPALAEAVESTDQNWFTHGHAPWQAQNVITHDGADAIVSGTIGHDQDSLVETTVNGPGRLSFWWRVSSERSFDFLIFHIDGQAVDGISGESGWLRKIVEINEGHHTLQWSYRKDFSVTEGNDAGYVDEVEFEPAGAVPPTIVQQPQSLTVSPGGTATFTVTATGTAPLTFQWQKDGENLQGEDAGELILEGVALSDEGAYSVQISNEAGSVISRSARLTVADLPPRITRQPGDRTVATGASAEFQVDASGTIPLRFQWLHNGTLISGATNRLLLLTGVTAEDNGDYQVRVFNDLGSELSEPAELLVVDSQLAPSITRQPVDQTVQAGDTAMFRLEAIGEEPLFYQWRFNLQEIPGATNKILTISNASLGQAGSYSAIVSNPFGSDLSRSAQLVVQTRDEALGAALDNTELSWTTSGDGIWFKQEVITHDDEDALESTAIGNTQSAAFSTAVTGPGQLSFFWRVSSELNYDFLHLFLNDESVDAISGETPWLEKTVTIPEGNHSLRWVYAKDQSFTDGADAGWVDEVRYAPFNSERPVVTQHPQNRSAFTGQDITLVSEALGTPPLDYQWQKDGEPIPNANSAQLRIVPVQFSDQGRYAVHVSNPAGQTISRQATLTVFDRLSSFADATDTQAFQFQHGGNRRWFAQAVETHDGIDALQSGSIGNNETSEFEIQLEGPVAVSFWWRVSSEPELDFLRLYWNGRIISQVSGESGWEQQYVSLPSGSHTLRWSYEKDAIESSGQDAGWVDEFILLDPGSDLNQDLGTTGLEWFSYGGNPWEPDPSHPAPGNDTGPSVRSGDINNGQQSTLAAFVELDQASALRFQWDVSSETSFDFLSFSLNGQLQERISGQPGWREIHLPLPSGRHLLEWRYEKDSTAAAGADTGWIDGVRFHPLPPDAESTLNLALETEGWPWQTAGHHPWFAQSEFAFDGVDAAQAGAIGNLESTRLQTQIHGPCILEFHWAASSEFNFDLLGFLVDGRLRSLRSGPSDWQQQQIPLPRGEHLLKWIYVKDALESALLDTAWLDLVGCIPVDPEYNRALDTENWQWDIGGNKAWREQAFVSHAGPAALGIGNLGDEEFALLETTVAGPGTLRFWWKVSSEEGFDFLDFYIDGVLQDGISGNIDWQEQSWNIEPGRHRVTWTYSKDAFETQGSDSAFLDLVSFQADPDPFEAWQQLRFSEEQLADPSISAATADPDDDGKANLGEFAFGTDPLVAEQEPTLTATLVELGADRFLNLTYEVTAQDPNLVITIQESRDLENWRTVPVANFEFKQSQSSEGTMRVDARAQDPVRATPQLFYRLTITREE